MRDISLSYYREKLDTLSIIPEKENVIRKQALLLLSFSQEYKKVAYNFYCPWEAIGLIHMMESSFDFQLNLHNGQPWFRETTLHPAGRGPFGSWESSAIDAIHIKLDGMPPTWSADVDAAIGIFLEKYNGLGYAKYHNVDSPYLWSFSNHGVGIGKYTSDGRYNKHAISSQPGAMVVLKYLRDHLEELTEEGKETNIEIFYLIKYNIDTERFSEVTIEFQMFVNDLVNRPRLHTPKLFHLKPDGIAGPETSNACKILFGSYINGDPRKEK